MRFALLDAVPDLAVLAMSDVALRARLGETPIDVVRYRYPPLEPPVPGPAGFPVAGLRDLATMKLAAIARRGIRRDFWDLREIARHHVSLRDAARDYVDRFGVAESNLYHVLRALTYFEDADKDPVFPVGLTAPAWAEIQAFFVRDVPGLLEP